MRAALITIAAATTTVPSAGGSIVHVPLNQVVPAGSPHDLEHQIGDYYFYFGFISVDDGAERHIGLFNYLPGTFYQFATDGFAGPLMNLPTGTPIGPSLPSYEQGVSEPPDTATPLEFIAGIQIPMSARIPCTPGSVSRSRQVPMLTRSWTWHSRPALASRSPPALSRRPRRSP
ncbi:MAG: hypothetical protein AMXMBFR58_36160 [Phycisphaerae bacterium]